MKKIYDKDGNEITKEDITILAFDMVKKIKNENKDNLAMQIANLANKRARDGEYFTIGDAFMVIGIVSNHNSTYPFYS